MPEAYFTSDNYVLWMRYLRRLLFMRLLLSTLRESRVRSVGREQQDYTNREAVVLQAVAIYHSPDISQAQRSCLTFLLIKMLTDPSYMPPVIDGSLDLSSETYLAKAVDLLLAEFPEDAADSFRLLVRTLNAHRLD